MTQDKLFTEKEQGKKRKWRKEQIFAFIIASIPLLGFVVFNGFPLLISFIGMFCNVDLYDLTNIQWNNFEGFKSVFIPGHAYELFYFDLAKYFYKAVVITARIVLDVEKLISNNARRNPISATKKNSIPH